MAFLVFRRPKMIEKIYAVLIKSKSEEKSKLSLLEKNQRFLITTIFRKIRKKHKTQSDYKT